jgi:hypothetical protein
MTFNCVPNWKNNFPEPAMNAVLRALDTWSAALTSNVAIQVTATWGVNLPGFDAICIPNPVQNFQNAPLENVWYPSALADKLANQDLKQNQPDMNVFFSNNVSWYTGTGSPANNQVDLQSIALHELGHGLGFVSAFWNSRGWPYFGSYGNQALIGLVNQVVDNTGQPLGFELPNLNSQPTVYGLHIQDLNGDQLTNPKVYPNNSIELGAPLVSNNLFFDLNRYQVYAPTHFAPFTSIDHLNDPNSLMRPSIGAGTRVRAIDAPVLAILNDLGWS